MAPLKFLLALIALALPGAARADFWQDAWLDPAMLEAHSLDGGSGFIRSPAPLSLPESDLSAGIHDYRVESGHGLPWGAEIGIQMELQDLDEYSWDKVQSFYFRWSPLTQARNGVGLSVGCEGVTGRNLGIGGPYLLPPEMGGLERQYVVAGGLLPRLPMAYASLGYGGGSEKAGAFGDLMVSPFPGMALIAEYDQGTNLGLRILLSTQIKLDLSVSDLQAMSPHRDFVYVLQDNVRFGVSYTEPWP